MPVGEPVAVAHGPAHTCRGGKLRGAVTQDEPGGRFPSTCLGSCDVSLVPVDHSLTSRVVEFGCTTVVQLRPAQRALGSPEGRCRWFRRAFCLPPKASWLGLEPTSKGGHDVRPNLPSSPAPVSLRRFTTAELGRGGADGLRSGREGLRPSAVVPGLTDAAPGDIGGHVALPVVFIEGPQPGGGFAVAGAATGLGRPGPE